jgi:hypothetical protein
MQHSQLRKLDLDGRAAITRRDPRAMRHVISALYGETSPRLVLMALSAAQALDGGDLVRALQIWNALAEVLGTIQPRPAST